jgi:hypothetical protein
MRALARRHASQGAWIALIAAAVGLLYIAAPQSSRNAAAAPGSRVNWQSGSWYVQGANVPWFNWGCDFGCGTSGGASDPTVNNAVGAAFSQLNANGTHVVRWWVFPGDAHQITRNAAGLPTGLDPAVYPDFDAALSLAAQYDIYFDFVLFSGPTSIPTSWETDATQRTALASALSPLFSRYRGNSRVLTWEIMNEPEFEIWNGHIAQSDVQATVRVLVNAVHANSTAMATVGAAELDGLPMWVGMGLDYYQAHWYDYMSSGNFCARCTDYPTVQARYGLDQPLVIGEMYAGPDVDAYQRFVDFYNKGYAGTWAWSLFPSHTNDHLSIDQGALRTFTSQHNDIGPRVGSGAATPTLTSTPTLRATPTSTPTATPTSGASTAISFDDLPNPNRTLSGQYPTGVVDWGNGAWFLAGPWGQFTTNSISFNGGTFSSASFNFTSPRMLIQLDAYNGSTTAATTLTLSCAGQPTVSQSLTAGQRQTLTTGWTGTCGTVTISSTNGWDTNFDNLVINSSGTVSTSTPTPTRTPTPTSATTRTVTFDDLTNPNRPLSGQYPSALIDWGSGAWFLSGPYGQFSTNSVSFNGSSFNTASFTFIAARRLVQLDAFNGGSTPSTITLTCGGQPTISQTVAAGQRRTIQTGWTGTCTSVAVGSSNGWATNFDSLIVQ